MAYQHRRKRKEDPSTLRAIMRRVMRRNPIQREDMLAERQALQHSIDRRAQGGMVRLVVRQMDCDCAEWTSSSLQPARALAVERAINAVYDNAEGRVNWWLASPSEAVERNERDHALEAFEEGHSHVIYA